MKTFDLNILDGGLDSGAKLRRMWLFKSGRKRSILITGATDGLGFALAKNLAMYPETHLLLHGRNSEKLGHLKKEIDEIAPNSSANYYLADFSSLREVRQMAQKISKDFTSIDVLINNAGLGVESQRKLSEDGFELIFQVNYLSAYLLTKLLLPCLARGDSPRILNIASRSQQAIVLDDLMLEKKWTGLRAYCQSKLALVMMAVQLAPEMSKIGIAINAIHPATLMPTKIVQGQFEPRDSLAEGVRNVIALVLDSKIGDYTGTYIDRSTQSKALSQVYDKNVQNFLKRESDKACGLPENSASAL